VVEEAGHGRLETPAADVADLRSTGHGRLETVLADLASRRRWRASSTHRLDDRRRTVLTKFKQSGRGVRLPFIGGTPIGR
jgi:hypothetical protein